MLWRFIHWSINQYFVPFYACILSHCMDRPQFGYLFFFWWTSGWFPPFGDCASYFSRHRYASLYLNPCFHFFWVSPQERDCWVRWLSLYLVEVDFFLDQEMTKDFTHIMKSNRIECARGKTMFSSSCLRPPFTPLLTVWFLSFLRCLSARAYMYTHSCLETVLFYKYTLPQSAFLPPTPQCFVCCQMWH